MDLIEAITHAEKLAPKNKGLTVGNAAFSNLVYYVAKWNDGYCVFTEPHIKKHPNIKWVYNTREKKMEDWKIKYTKGDLVRDAENNFDVIGHGCNCWCTMGKGIALDVKKKYPRVYDADRATGLGDKAKLGTYTMWQNENVIILNLYTQWHYYGSDVKADYDAIRSCMKLIKQNFSGKKIGLPLIGAGLAKGDWGIISSIIEEELNGEDLTVMIWENSKESWQLKLLE
ncbi:MAG: hypothetical protein AABY15_05535 [Nanoarchaeota archaeon]